MLCHTIKKLRKKNTIICPHTFLTKYDRILMSTYVFISVCDHVTFAGIQKHLSLLLILYFIYPWQEPQQILAFFFSGEVIFIFIHDVSISFVILPGLCCCSLSFIQLQDLVALRDILKDLLHSRHNLSYFHCGEVIQLPHDNLDQSPLLIFLFLSQSVGFKSKFQSIQGRG